MSGLSTANFMGGFLQGLNAIDTIAHRKRASDRADKQIGMQEETHERQIQQLDNQLSDYDENKKLEAFDRESKDLLNRGVMPNEDFYKRHGWLGFNRIATDEVREEQMRIGTALHRAINDGVSDDETLDALNLLWKSELEERTQKDGLQRKVIGIVERKVDGKKVKVPYLEVTKKNGKTYKAPLTVQGTSDDSDEIYQLTPERLQELHEVSVNRAEIAYQLEKNKDDPAAFITKLREVAGFKTESNSDFTAQKGFDEQGNEQLYAIDKKTGKYIPVGGSGLSSAQASLLKGSGANDGTKPLDVEKHLGRLQGIRTSQAFDTPEDREAAYQQAKQEAELEFGAPIETVSEVIKAKRQIGDYSPITYEDVAIFQVQLEREQAAILEAEGQGETDDAEQIDTQGLAEGDQQTPPPIPEETNETQIAYQTITNLEKQAAAVKPSRHGGNRAEYARINGEIRSIRARLTPSQKQQIDKMEKERAGLKRHAAKTELMQSQIMALTQKLQTHKYDSEFQMAHDESQLAKLKIELQEELNKKNKDKAVSLNHIGL